MSYSTGTTHYNLPQTVGTDKRDWTDTNEAFSAVDTALYGAVQDAETATSGIQTLNTAVDTINGKLATDEGNISTLSGKVSTLESTVSGHTSAIADVRSDLQDNIESRKEATATSTHAYSIGDTFYYNDVLYKATANIGVGDTIVPNTNCTGITVMSEIDQINSDLGDTDISGIGDGTVTGAISSLATLHHTTVSATTDGAGRVILSTVPTTAKCVIANVKNTGQNALSCETPFYYEDLNDWRLVITSESGSNVIFVPNTSVTLDVTYWN